MTARNDFTTETQRAQREATEKDFLCVLCVSVVNGPSSFTLKVTGLR